MITSANRGRTDMAARVVHASPQAIYRALLNPEALVKWLPPEGMRGSIDVFEPREGGTYRMTLTYERQSQSTRGKTSENADAVQGRFVKLVADERVVQQVEFEADDPAFAGTMTISWLLEAVPNGTGVTIVCENVPEGILKEDHDAGLRSSLQNLASYVE